MKPLRFSLQALLPLLIFVALVVVMAIALNRTDPSATTQRFSQHIGEAVPVTPIGSFDPAVWRGKTYIVNFFASWCVPCKGEQPQLIALQRLSIPLIGIAYRDKMAGMTKFLRDEGNPFAAVVADSDGSAGLDWGLTGVPETYLIDAKGIIRWHFSGPLTVELIEQELLPLWRSL